MLPLTAISPVPFKVIEGKLRITSIPVPPFVFLNLVTSKTCLSILLTTEALSDFTTTSFNCLPKVNFIMVKSTVVLE